MSVSPPCPRTGWRRGERRCSTTPRIEDGASTEVLTDLDRALSRLPEEFKTPLLLAEVEGLPLEEVARVMDCPVGTVKSRIFRAKERLREYLKDYGEDLRR